jgi:hypothetical protein
MISVRRTGLRHSMAMMVSMVLIGCGGGDPDQISAVPASGTVTYNGKPVETGTIGFIPKAGRPASGAIKDGQFTLTTYESGDGATPGKHRVIVSSTKLVPSKVAGADPETVYLIPAMYASPGESYIDVEIPPEGNSKIEIKIENTVRKMTN